MSDGNTVPLTHPAPPVNAPYPVPDTSTTQVITPADLPQNAVGPFGAPADGATVTLSAPALSEQPPYAPAPPFAPPPTEAPTQVTTPPIADAPTYVTPPPVAPAPATPPAPAPPTAPADAPTTSTGTDQSATQVIKPETLAAANPTFANSAETDLQKATTALDAVDKGEVKLDLDKQAVQDLVKLITQARDLVDGVHRTAVDNLDVELKFGNNWVGEAISRRLREVAVGDDRSAVSVIGDFLDVLFEVEKTIRDAARNLEDADDEAADAFGKAGEVKGP
ncbi:hypothetical protein GCM10010492_43710 [Saccharothrix mutabilis subsp. mutabilis]|uniref:Uncharacterized protein n=1 Tax=Saccharothrix mutabilis subsp. mutabilis TaxID=66855 RepID=A0ABP3DQU9_9PSEU